MLYRLLILSIGMIAVALAWFIATKESLHHRWIDEKKELADLEWNFEPSSTPSFELVDPETAPEEIRPLVLYGHQLMLETRKMIPQYAGDWVSCSNCHFSAGNSMGKDWEGISLVGVTREYPKKLSDGQLYTLADRINSCFERSLNGKPLPKESHEMKALLAYLEWISSPVPIGSKTPWLGLKELSSTHEANPEKGAKDYAIYCAMCHAPDGSGQQREENLSYPPLWGDHSFNDDAGMNRLPMTASFIYHNMPFNDPTLSGGPALTEEEALDIASFIISQPRPHFGPHFGEKLDIYEKEKK
jgi:thiosulfate dehydrogenase